MRTNAHGLALAALAGAWLTSSSASAISRQEIVDGAPAFEEHSWVCGADNLTASCADGSWQPAVTATGPQVGLPYCWGGWVTIDQFDQQIAAGYGAGSMTAGLFLECTTGVDCSGYVSQLWQHPVKLGTATIPAVSYEIDTTEMQPGDVFNAADSHVIMFLGTDDTGSVVVTESTIASACRGVCRRARPWSVFSSYTPRAYHYADVDSSTAAGTTDDPIAIEAFPFQDTRNTAEAESDIFDFYSAAPDTDETGPEYIYVFHAATGGILSASVLDGVGVDIDIHLLGSLDADDCLARGDKDIYVEITDPGTYYLVADTYVGDSATEYTGVYLLTADFDGELAPPGEDPDGGIGGSGGAGGFGGAGPVTGLTGDDEGCGCRWVGRRQHGAPWAGLLGLGAALAWTRRRRRAP